MGWLAHQQPVSTCDGMTDEEFNMMMATGYKQVVEDISCAAEDVLEELKMLLRS